MKSVLRFAALGVSLSLAGCATPLHADTPSSPPPAQAAPEPVTPPEPPPRTAADDEPAPPAAELTPQTLFQLLAAELASQRGEIGAAWSTYMDLARTTRDARLARRATELATNARALEQAAESAQLWSTLAPQSGTAAQALELLRLASGNLAELEPALSERLAQARQAGTLTAAYPALQAQLLRSRDRPAAWAVMRRLSAPDLTLPAARMARAELAAAANDFAAAYAEARAALDLAPDNEAAAILAARTGWRIPAMQPASLTLLERFLARAPQANEARYAYARMLLDNQQFEAARTQLEHLRQHPPVQPAVLFSLAQLAWRQQQPKKAQDHLKALLALPRSGPRDDTPAFLFLAQIAEEQRQLDEAIAWLEQVTAPEERGPADLRRAVLLGQLGRLDDARDTVAEAPARTLRERTLRISTEALILRNAGQHDQALDVLRAGLESHPDHPDLLYDLAMAAERLDRIDEAEKALRRLIVLRPDHAHALNALGYTLADRNVRLDEARTLIENALRLAPDDAQIIDSMGWVLFRLKDYTGAITQLRRAHALQPDAEIAAHLGEALWAAGHTEEARQIWRAAQTKDPNNAVLRSTLSRLAVTL